MPKNMTAQKSRRGFTLIELLIYISISTVILVGIASLFGFFLYAQNQGQGASEVEDQGVAAMTLITQVVRNANAIYMPATGATSSLLSLQQTASSTTSTTFSLSGTTLQIIQGSSSAVALTNNNVSVTNLLFTNLTWTGGEPVVRIQFTINHIKLQTTSTVDYSQTFYDSAARRP
jgi:Tfp pilus assembly protein PilW